MAIREGERRDADERRSEQLRRLASAALLVNSTLSLEEVLQVVAAQAREATGAAQAAARVTLADGRVVTVSAPPDDGVEPVEIGADARRQPGLVAAPLVGREGRPLGVLQVTGDAAFDEDDEFMVVQLAQLASAAVENARLVDELRFKSALLEAEHETAIEGVLVVDLDGAILQFNRRFVEMWGIPDDVVESRSDEAAIASVLDEVVDPDAFAERIAHLYEHPELESRDEIRLRDGRVFDRYSAPLRDSGGVLHGRVWFFRDVSDGKRAETELRQRLDELAAVYVMAEAVGRATTLDEVFEAALDAIAEGLSTPRAAILLCDDAGVMRFRAWRGLSDEYRAAVEGHSPWAPDDAGAQPVLVPDVAADGELAPLRETLAREGIRALAFVPLVHHGRLLGKFMLYHGEPHDFASSEIRLAQTLAGHIAGATERKRAEDALRESRNQLEVIFRSVADGITVQGPDGAILFANDGAARLCGFPDAETMLSTPVAEITDAFEILDEQKRPFDFSRLPGRRALAGEGEVEETLCYRIRATGEQRWSVLRATPVPGLDGGVAMAINVFHDVTERKLAEDKLRFLAEATDLLASSLDIDTTLARLGRLIVPTMADYCIVELLDEDGSLRQVSLVHADPEGERLLHDLRRRYPPAGNPGHPATRATTSGEAVLVDPVTEEDLRAAAVDEEHVRLYLGLRPSSYLVVPLVARGRTLGAISFGTGASGRRYSPADVTLAQDLVARAAIAVDNALLYREARESLGILDAVVESTTDAVFVKDREGRYLLANAASAAIAGRTPAEVIGRTTEELYGEAGAAIQEHDARVLATGEWEAFEEQPLGPDGPTFLATKGPYRDADGNVVGVIGVARDITERKGAEEAQRFLARTGELANESLDVSATLARVTALAVPQLGDYCAVYVREDDALVRVAYAGPEDELSAKVAGLPARFPLDPQSPLPAVRAFLSREPVYVPRQEPAVYEELVRLGAARDDAERLGARHASAYVAPLVARGEAIGVVSFGTYEREYPHANLEVGLEFARRIAVSLDNARLYESERQARAEAERAAETVRRLQAVTEAGLAHRGVEELLRELVDRIGETLAVDTVVILLLEGDELVVRAEKGLPHDDEEHARVPLGRGFAGKIAAERRPVAIEDKTSADIHRPVLRRADVRSLLGAPLVVEDRVVGVVHVGLRSKRRFTEDEVRLLQLVADRVAMGIDQAQLFEAEQEARRRLSFLAEASTLLASSLDYEATLASVARLAIESVADWCSISVLDADGETIRPLVTAHRDPALARWAEDLARRSPTRLDSAYGVGKVIRTGEPEFVPEVDRELIEAVVRERPEAREALERIGLRSAIVVPLTVRSTTFGAITFASESERVFTEQDLALAMELARRAAVAVDNARLYGDAQEAYARLDTLLVSAPVGIGFWDRDLNYVRVNDALAEINGLPADEHVGRHVTEVIPDMAHALEPLYRRVIESGEPMVHMESTDAEARALGDERHWLSSYYPVRTADGDVIGVGAVIMEVTAQRKAEERLRLLAETGDLFSSSLDVAEILGRLVRIVVPRVADACNIYLKEGPRLVRVAHAHADPDRERLMDRMPDAYEGGDDPPAFWRHIVEESRPLLQSDLGDDVVGDLVRLGIDPEMFAKVGSRSMIFVPFVSRGETLGVMTLGAMQAGRYTDLDLDLALELARKASAAIDNARLLAEQREARAEAERRAQAAQALEFVGDGVFLVDRDGVVRVWNPAAEAITGLAAAEVVGRTPADAIPGWATVEPLVPVGAETAGTRPETVPLDVGGRELWLSVSGVAFPDGTVYAFRDLTEERAIERLKSDFVSTVSHELRTPLAAIYGAAMTLQRPDVVLGEDQRQGMLTVVASESERLARIVNDVLWASRLDSGVLEVSIETCDPRAIARGVVDAARTHLPEWIELTLDAPETLPAVAADADKVRQVLVNLVDNAIKYSPDGGRVEVFVEDAGRAVRFSVRDEGLGIPASEHGRIFEKFFRLDPNLTRGVGGTGLGLYICRELVRRMDGRIWVTSAAGAGSTFAFELPVAADRPAPSPADRR